MSKGNTTIPITFALDRLSSYTDEFLATLWHVAQANPAPHGDYQAGNIASKVGAEIIRRWLGKAPVEMYHHQQRDNYWSALTKIAKYEPPPGIHGTDPAWHSGRWVPKGGGDAAQTDRIAQAIGDPGSILPREPGETVTRWSTRAVEAVLAGWRDTEQIRRTETVHLPAPDGAA